MNTGGFIVKNSEISPASPQVNETVLPEPVVLTPEDLDRVVGGQITGLSFTLPAEIRSGILRTGVVVGPIFTPGFGL